MIMQLAAILAALISAVGTLCGALGGIALSGSLEWRRQQRAATSEQAAVHDQACTELIAAVTGLRVDIELACARHWRDMNVRLASIQEQAATTGVRASRIAMTSPDPAEAEAALALGRCASSLSAWTAKVVSLGDFGGPSHQFVAGQIVERPDLTELDNLLAVFLRLVSPGRVAIGQPRTRPGAAPRWPNQPTSSIRLTARPSSVCTAGSLGSRATAPYRQPTASRYRPRFRSVRPIAASM